MKKLFALLLTAALVFSFAACGKEDTANDTTTAPEATADELTEAAADPAADETASVTPDESSESNEEVSVDSSEAASAADESTTEAESTVPAITAAPTATADIIAMYNNAINSAYDAKAGFNKERYTDNENLNTKGALGALKDLVYKFMGIGAENKYTMDVTKGQWESDVPHHYLRKSTLTAADVTSATCTANGNQYTVNLKVKDGSSKGSENESYNNSPVDKCGICVGEADKSYFDHKTGPVIYSAISGTYASAVIEESYKNATVKAVIDGATGHIVSLTVEYDISCTMDVGIVGSGDATGTTHIIYKNFKY